MKLSLLHGAGALVVAVNLLVSVNAARNRTGAPDADVVVSECEVWIDARDPDNSFTSARIHFSHSEEQWLTREKLREIGFRASGREPARAVFVAIALREGAVGASFSRLEAMDAAVDPAVLRARHPDRSRVLILAAEASAHDGRGRLSGLARPVVHVPFALARKLDGASCAGPGTGSRRITLRTGSRYEPWIADVADR